MTTTHNNLISSYFVLYRHIEKAPRLVSVFFMLCVFDASEKQIAAMRADFANDVDRRRKILPQRERNPDSTRTVRESGANTKTAFWIAALRLLVKHSQ